MGNVFASGLAPPPLAEPVPSPNMPAEENVPKSSQQNSTDQNPGSLEDLHKKCKDVFPTVFDGSKFMVTKALSNHFQISHTLNMTSPNPGYRFGATYVGTNQISPVEAYPILLGDIDPNGNLNANIFHQYKNIRGKFAAQVQDNKFVGTQVTTDYRGSNYTASATFANVDILNHSGVAVLQYLQNVTPSIAVGTEMAYQYGPQVPGGEIALMSLAGRYTGANYTVSGSVGAASIHACFWRKHNENIQVGVEAETNLRLGESVCTIGYQVDLPKANMVFRGMVDTTWNVGAVLEKKLHPLPFTLALSGMINHTNVQHKFGIGLIIG
ncbi:mitochondrial import receptor subunit TOM40 homolog 1 [Parasteatoda tepidariorum]|uniref:mitochondrial import receptor subunit TOM40 homolog 1 n=1 Tax=Parasteatoda tepidariorum TaxID=114398 RepID=UPI00077F9C2B|nr:mitochondrial import receptor subunit TOM40 homolog 1 [Parasteatoda tepidariorum]